MTTGQSDHERLKKEMRERFEEEKRKRKYDIDAPVNPVKNKSGFDVILTAIIIMTLITIAVVVAFSFISGLNSGVSYF